MDAMEATDLQQLLLAQYQMKGPIRFDSWMKNALYHPAHGYYRRTDRARVGKSSIHDFSTASHLGEVWNRWVRAALKNLLPKDSSPHDYSLVEIGTEPEGSPITRAGAGVFKEVRARPLGDSSPLPSKSVIFFNEVLDAQPFRRVRFTPAGWCEAFVVPSPENSIATWSWRWQLIDDEEIEFILSAISEPLPGQIIDLPLAATSWLKQLWELPWEGVLLTCDYGKTWHELVHEFPEGTGRGFRQQQVQSNLLEHPGDMDLTCDPCWDWLEDVLSSNKQEGQNLSGRLRLESFWMQYARDEVEATFAEATLSSRGALMELLHPRFYGLRFEALFARKL